MDKVFKKLTAALSVLLCAAIVFLMILIPGYIRSDRKIDFFSASKIVESIRNMELNMTSVIYVQNDKGVWEEYRRLHGEENRIWVGIKKVPENLKNAFIAIEDQHFYTHGGVDWKRTFAAVGNEFFKFDTTEFGGSTITQQLIKNITRDNDKSKSRKFREIIRALLIDGELSKTEIMEAYLNTIPLSNGICGVQVAANYYFNKDVSELNLTECAAIAAITKNPTRFNPLTEKGAAANKERRQTVLDEMLDMELITYEEYDEAYNTPLVLDNSQKEDFEGEVNNYFVDTLIEQVIEDLAEKYNLTNDIATTAFYNGGFKIYATMKPDIQETMEKVYTDIDKYFNVTAENPQTKEREHAQSAMTIMDYEGHIVGIVGGAGEKKTNRGLNRAYNSPRQPGSTMKPLGVYALAIDKNIVEYDSRVLDRAVKNYYPDGKSGPKEWFGYYKGTVRLNYAIRKSMNAVPVRLLKEKVGVDASYDFLVNKLGCKHLVEEDKNLSSLALGGCRYGMTTTESAAAFAIFGSGGIYHKPTTYYKIERANGEIVIDYDEKGTRAIAEDSATIMNRLLQEVVYGSEGTGTRIASFSSMKAYAKTGTSSESNDLWMVAGSPYYIGSVWYGFDFNHKISNKGAANIWRDVMKSVHKGLEKKEFTYSENVVKKGSAYYKKNVDVDDPVFSSGNTDWTSSKEESSSSASSSSIPSTSTPSSSTPSTSSETTTTPETPPATEPTDPPEAPPESGESSSSGSAPSESTPTGSEGEST